MVQNQSKGLQKKAASNRRPTSSATKKGKRTVAPKQKDAVKHAALHKSLSAKITNSIERQIAGAAGGNLTLLKNERPDLKGGKEKGKKSK